MREQLTVEQSKHLFSLGISEEKAKGALPNRTFCAAKSYYDVFTLKDLLEILPKEPLADYCLQITNWRDDIWYVGYTMQDEDPLIMYNCRELIDGLYKLVIWCIEHGYIETK